MKHVALIGAKGYIGSTLYKELGKYKTLNVEAVTRQNYSYWKKLKYDIVINSAMPSARFWAKNNPDEDFNETVEKTADIVYGWNYEKIIQISTISARTELNTIYGRHKAAAETLCNFGNNLIIRLTATYSDTLKKGALIDILEGKKVYVNKKSRYSFASLEFVCSWIAKNLDKKGIIEVGAKNSITLEEIVKYLKLGVAFEGPIDVQRILNPLPEFPDAYEVLPFLKEKSLIKAKKRIT